MDGADLVIATGGSTDVEVTLVGPMSVETSQGPFVVHTLRFAADDAAAAVGAVRRAGDVDHHEGASPDRTGTARSSSRWQGPGST